MFYSSLFAIMSEFKVLFAEGSSINKPPMFNGMNYAFWEIRMKIFMESIDSCIWEAVVHGTYVPPGCQG